MVLSVPPIVTDHFEVGRASISGQHGIVASQHYAATEAGVRMLEAGGNAADAAVATALALGVVEPWMSGIGGGGFMLVGEAATGQVHVADFGMVAPGGLDPDRYPLDAGEAGNDPIFSWPKVVEDRNQIGAESICVPGAVAGLSATLERFGSVSWADALQPAIELADRGLPCSWTTTLNIAHAADTLRHFETASATYLPNGLPPIAAEVHRPLYLPLGTLPVTLRRLAAAGARDFYEGEIAELIVRDLQAAGSSISADDLASYRAEIRRPLTVPYRGAEVHLAPGFCGGPTFAKALDELKQTLLPEHGVTARAYLAWANALNGAFRERLAALGHAGDMASLAASTTHLSVVDKQGNMVALTNTLLERFGSRLVLPGTGILMNNGMFWFDPRAGQPNSLAPGARPLANMCPVLATKDGKPWFALGASGGRRIIPAGLQLTSLLIDFGLSLEDAYRVPRLDVSGEEAILADHRLNPTILEALAEQYNVALTYDSVGLNEFAKPQTVLCEGGYEGAMQWGAVCPTLAPARALAAGAAT